MEVQEWKWVHGKPGLQINQRLAQFTEIWVILLRMWLRIYMIGGDGSYSPFSVSDTEIPDVLKFWFWLQMFPLTHLQGDYGFQWCKIKLVLAMGSVIPPQLPEINRKNLTDFSNEHVRTLISCYPSPEFTPLSLEQLEKFFTTALMEEMTLLNRGRWKKYEVIWSQMKNLPTVVV